MTFGELKSARLLGKGGMSEVWEAENPRLGSRHAVKVYAYAKDDAQVRARFEQEGRMLAKMHHPRVVGVSDIGTTEEGKPYFVMDLVLNPEGVSQSLADVPEGEADEATIGKWYDDIRDGLAYIHSKGIVHRDLKLQNVMVGPDGHVVLTDFGISRVGERSDGKGAFVDPVNTLISVRDGKQPLMGSLGYMAPELEMGVAASPQSDWYALGVIVYKLLTGSWCDARTDVVGTLSTYDPVWTAIVPKLLHANPQGRECLSYAEAKLSNQEKSEFDWEEKWMHAKSRGHFARHFARYASAVVLLLAIALGWTLHEFHAQREVWRLKYENAGLHPPVPTFDELFRVPTEAKAEEQFDNDNNVTMPSRSQFEAARVDALVLAQPTLSGLSAGNITFEKAIEDFERFSQELEEESEVTPFDSLSFGGNVYMQFGESEPLRMLFENAIEKLRVASEQ